MRRVGEIFPDKTAIDDINDDTFGQLTRNKTVHLLAFFLMVHIGVEVTIGGMISHQLNDFFTSLVNVKIKMDCNILNDCSRIRPAMFLLDSLVVST